MNTGEPRCRKDSLLDRRGLFWFARTPATLGTAWLGIRSVLAIRTGAVPLASSARPLSQDHAHTVGAAPPDRQLSKSPLAATRRDRRTASQRPFRPPRNREQPPAPPAPLDSTRGAAYIFGGAHDRAAFLGACEGPDVVGIPQGSAAGPPSGVRPPGGSLPQQGSPDRLKDKRFSCYAGGIFPQSRRTQR